MTSDTIKAPGKIRGHIFNCQLSSWPVVGWAAPTILIGGHSPPYRLYGRQAKTTKGIPGVGHALNGSIYQL